MYPTRGWAESGVREMAERWISRKCGEERAGRKVWRNASERLRFVVRERRWRWDVFSAFTKTVAVEESPVNVFWWRSVT
jgi:hypothetical protein